MNKSFLGHFLKCHMETARLTFRTGRHKHQIATVIEYAMICRSIVLSDLDDSGLGDAGSGIDWFSV